MTSVLAIDPGTEQSAYVEFDGGLPRHGEIVPNEHLISTIRAGAIPMEHMAIEMVASYGMPVGAETFETVLWIGRFIEAWCPGDFTKVYRKDVKLHLCQSMRAKDGNIRQALIDKFPASGGGKTPQIGTVKEPGPLYGFKSHLWSALAVAVTWTETQEHVVEVLGK